MFLIQVVFKTASTDCIEAQVLTLDSVNVHNAASSRSTRAFYTTCASVSYVHSYLKPECELRLTLSVFTHVQEWDWLDGKNQQVQYMLLCTRTRA